MPCSFVLSSGQAALLFRPRPSLCYLRPRPPNRPSISYNPRPHPVVVSATSTSGNDTNISIDKQDDLEELTRRTELARKDAERLELAAEAARLESERAEILAERRRLELNKFKEKNEKAPPDNGDDDTTTTTTTTTAPPATSTIPSYAVKNNAGLNSPIPLPTPLVLGVDFPQVAEKDIAIIKEKICGMKTFFCTEVDRSPFSERVVFRGNLRLEPEGAIERLEALALEHGIADRVRLFLLLDPKDDSNPGSVSDPKKPVLVALPAEVLPNKAGLTSNIFSALSALITVNTTLLYGLGIFGTTPGFLEKISAGELQPLLDTVPIAVGILLLGLLHEAAHRIAAQQRGVKLGLPFPIPSLQLGTYGTITPLESYPRTRSDLFDVAVAGPLAGICGSLVALCAGLALSNPTEAVDTFLQLPTSLLSSSFLVKVLSDWLLLAPTVAGQTTIALHPLAMAGFTGLIINSLNMFPVGRLDGGRIAQALFGRDNAGRISGITLFVQGISTLFGNSPILLFWGLVCVFLQREADAPALNEIVEPSESRSVLGCALLLISILAVAPFPGQII